MKSKNEIKNIIDKLRITEDWGGGHACLMLADEAATEWEKHKTVVADRDSPDGWGEEPREIEDGDQVLWATYKSEIHTWANSCFAIVTENAQPLVERLCEAAGELWDSDASPYAYITIGDLMNQ